MRKTIKIVYRKDNNIDEEYNNKLKGKVEELLNEKVYLTNYTYGYNIEDVYVLLGEVDFVTKNYSIEVKVCDGIFNTFRQTRGKIHFQINKNKFFLENKKSVGIIFDEKGNILYYSEDKFNKDHRKNVINKWGIEEVNSPIYYVPRIKNWHIEQQKHLPIKEINEKDR